mgnify:CR=1 FL=1
MKIETLTPQILALYLGQKCEFPSNGDIQYGFIGSVNNAGFLTVNWGLIESGKRACHEVTPHLRRLESLTEAEARELYEISRGEKWDYEYNSYAANRDRGDGEMWSCIENWWMGNYEMFAENGNWLVGDPNVWLHLLSLGFDLFNLIDAGLAKEIETKI